MGRNLLKLLKGFDDVIFSSMVSPRHRHFYVSQQLKNVEGLCCFFVF